MVLKDNIKSLSLGKHELVLLKHLRDRSLAMGKIPSKSQLRKDTIHGYQAFFYNLKGLKQSIKLMKEKFPETKHLKNHTASRKQKKISNVCNKIITYYEQVNRPLNQMDMNKIIKNKKLSRLKFFCESIGVPYEIINVLKVSEHNMFQYLLDLESKYNTLPTLKHFTLEHKLNNRKYCHGLYTKRFGNYLNALSEYNKWKNK